VVTIALRGSGDEKRSAVRFRRNIQVKRLF